jgi:hypothetical protein
MSISTFVEEIQYLPVITYREAIYIELYDYEFRRAIDSPAVAFMRRSTQANRARAVKATSRGLRRDASAVADEAGPGSPLPQGEGPAAGAGFARRLKSASLIPNKVSAEPAARCDPLSTRAENVLKELAVEITGEAPPRGRWIPTSELLRKLRFNDLAAARNCGPRTADEIIEWARSQGVTIQRPFHAGKSLAAMWRDIVAKSSVEEFSRAEIAEALERSARRKNTRIPVAFQTILLKALKPAGN